MSDLKESLVSAAKALGFAQVRILLPERQERYEQIALSHKHDTSHRCLDARDALPGCRSVVQLIYPYTPYELHPPIAAPSAYYIASNACREKARELANWLVARGYEATSEAGLPEKAIAERSGAGRYGRNGIIAAEDYGSRISLASIVTTAELAPDAACEMGESFSPECEHCSACVAACPVGALGGDSAVDTARCLRAQPDGVPFPAGWRKHLGGSIIGCDLCQDCCPRNAKVGRVSVPDAVRAAFDLQKLLSGDISGVEPLIGKNYARKARLRARACYLSANLGRRDCLPLIRALTSDENDTVRDAANWAVAQLQP